MENSANPVRSLPGQSFRQRPAELARLYAHFTAISIRAQMQYRASFLMLMVGHFITTGVEFLGIVALFHRFGSLRGWSLPEASIFYGIVNTGFALAEGIGRGFDVFPAMVKSGDFDRLLLRPRSTAFQVAAMEMQGMRLGRLAQGLLVLGWGAAHLAVRWSAADLLLVCLTVLGGACLFYGLFVLQATMSFWTVETLEIMNTVTYGGTETAQYPMTIYRPWFRRFFTFVIPLVCMNYIPVEVLLRRAGTGEIWRYLAPLTGMVFLAATLKVWQFGVRHYRSTGS
jgi:ABC-2 type transport system permease protein